MTDLTATEWFDQFPDAPGWEHEQWCARHWAPAPILGANGIGAAAELLGIVVNEVAATCRSPEALNAQMQAAGRLCCTLGDERMYELWGHWPPSTVSAPEAPYGPRNPQCSAEDSQGRDCAGPAGHPNGSDHANIHGTWPTGGES